MLLLNLHSFHCYHPSLQMVLLVQHRLAHGTAKNVVLFAPASSSLVPSTSTPTPSAVFRRVPRHFLAKNCWPIVDNEFGKNKHNCWVHLQQMLSKCAASALLLASRLATKARRSSPPVRHTIEKEATAGGPEKMLNEEERKAGRRKRKESRPAKQTGKKEKKLKDDPPPESLKEVWKKSNEDMPMPEFSMKHFWEEFDKDWEKGVQAGKHDPIPPYLKDEKRRTRIFFVELLYLLLVPYLLFRHYDDRDPVRLEKDPETGAWVKSVQMEWAEFRQKLLNSGQIEKLTAVNVSSKRDQHDRKGKPVQANVLLKMRSGAKAADGTAFAPFYHMKVSDFRKLEHAVRSTEIDTLGLAPDQWAEIELIQPSFWPKLILMGLFAFALCSLFHLFYNTVIADIFYSPYKMRIFDPASKDAVNKKALKVRFRHVAGLHEAKVEIAEFVDYLRRPGRYTKLGAKFPKGALLTGPPGGGKTLLAKALAGESNVPFINMNGTDFVEMVGGLGAQRVRKLFKEAKSRAPCIIYIDEIDAIGRKRVEYELNNGYAEIEHTLNQLLVEMDGMGTDKGIVVIGSTNRPDILDKALLRPGRFDRHVHIDLPTLAERKDIFDVYLAKIRRDNRLTGAGVSQRLAQMTPGFSGADIANVVNEAAIHAATACKKLVQLEDIQHAMDKIRAGPEKRNRTLVEEEREVLAVHESGHALVGWLLEHTDALLKVTIVPRTSAALGFAQYAPKDRKLFTREELFDRMCMMLGGRAAENITFGRITSGGQNDLEKVTKKAQAMVKWYGMCEALGPLSFYPGPDEEDARRADFMAKPYSRKLANLIDQEVSRLVADAYYATERLLRENRDKLDKLARTLLERETLSYEEVILLIGPPKYKKNVVDMMPEEMLPPNEEEVAS